jgi:integrase
LRPSRENGWRCKKRNWPPATFAKAQWTLETLVCPYIGSRPIAKLGATDVLKVLKRIEGRGIHETAHRTRQRCSQVFRYAVQTERAAHDVTADLRGALAPVVSEHHAAITEPARIGELLRAIDGYTGHTGTAYALKLAPLLFVRPHGALSHGLPKTVGLAGGVVAKASGNLGLMAPHRGCCRRAAARRSETGDGGWGPLTGSDRPF